MRLEHHIRSRGEGSETPSDSNQASKGNDWVSPVPDHWGEFQNSAPQGDINGWGESATAVQELSEASCKPACKPNPPPGEALYHYSGVYVLILSWKDCDLGAEHEVACLEWSFKNDFKFMKIGRAHV